MSKLRSHSCSQLNDSLVGQKVSLAGWVHRRRDHGGVVFVDLRDRSGLCQIVIPPDLNGAHELRNEFVIAIEGTLNKRPESQSNSKLSSGNIEIAVSQLKILARAEPLPFPIDDESQQSSEATRLKYRYLDLRRPQLQKNFILRHRLLQETRKYFDAQGFLEIETPILYKSTPEGARDYLVPSRVHHGQFFALPQSPQTLKQLLMIAGVERYCQIARCFRDEDLRADRQPEFTQIDLEMSFMSQYELMEMMEGFIKHTWKYCLGVDVSTPIPRMEYAKAMSDYGSDKPDLRYGLKLHEVSDVFSQTTFKVFSGVVQNGGSIIALPVCKSELNSSGVELPAWSRKFYDGLATVVAPFGMKGVAWLRRDSDSDWSGSVAKFLSAEELKVLSQKLSIQVGDVCFLGADRKPLILDAMGTLRQYLGKELGLPEKSKTPWAFTWVVDFPLFQYDETDGRYYAAHHPFTRPHEDDLSLFLASKDLKKVRAHAYDLVLNGFELGGGSLRIYDSAVQAKMFEHLGLTPQEAQEKFGFFMDALKFGTPPHGGIALGVDRMAMLMCGADSLREVIAFPKTARAQCLMSESPSPVAPDQMAELRLQVIRPT